MRVELRRDLEVAVARMVRPAVERLTAQVAREAQMRAPAARVWLTAADERVRASHADADGQTIPANLRFKLKRQVYVRGGGRGSRTPGRYVLDGNSFDLAREPRDASLPDDQKQHCRCADVTMPGLIARAVHAGPVVVEGARVRGTVSVRFPRIVESHTGTSADRPERFLSEALRAVAARTRGRAQRA